MNTTILKGGGYSGKTSLISVIVPVYNVEKYINECLESIVNQTYKNMEIICIDDKGEDNSIETVKEYAIKDDRIKIITHDKNYGLAISRNTGLKNANGEYIFFLDSDDYITFDIIEKLFNKITLDKSDIAVASARAFCEDNEKTIKERVEKYNRDFQQLCKTNSIQIDFNNFNLFSDILPHTAWGRLYKAEFLKKNNITFIEKNAVCEDEGFFIKTLSHYPLISYIQDVGVMYRIRKGSIISKSLENKKAIKEKVKHVKLVLNDAFEHIAKTNNKELSKKLIKKVKQSQTYGSYFDIKFIKIIKISLKEHDKVIRLFNITLYREKMKDKQTKVYKVLGIVIKKKKINPKL